MFVTLMESEVSGVLSISAEIKAPEERVSAYGWKALAGSVIGFRMDGFDIVILGFMLAADHLGRICLT